MEDGGSSSGSVGGVTAGLEAAITEKQETEAKLVQAELRIAQHQLRRRRSSQWPYVA